MATEKSNQIDAVLKRLEKLEQENIVLRRSLERESRLQGNDPNVSAERTEEILARSMSEPEGRFRWAVTPPGWIHRRVEFNCDTQDRDNAITEYKRRFKTDFRQDYDENNHKIELIGRWEDGQLVPPNQPPKQRPKEMAGA